MTKTFTIILTLLSFVNLFSQIETLDNSSIIEMKKSNLSIPIIKSSIENASDYNFDITTKGLQQLSNNKVDDEIVVLIMKKQKDKLENIIVVDGLKFDKKEFGLFINNNGEKLRISSHLTQVDFGMKLKAQIPNAMADIGISSDIKSFYFNFGVDENATTNSAYNLINSISDPNEGELVKLSKSGKKREFQVGKVGMGGIKSEIPSKIRIEYAVEKVKYNLYKITIKEELKPGEYGFIFGAINPGATMKIYDFSVK